MTKIEKSQNVGTKSAFTPRNKFQQTELHRNANFDVEEKM